MIEKHTNSKKMKMTRFKKLVRTIIALAAMLLFAAPAQSQFLKKLGKAAERAAKNTVENRVERETQKKTDAALDSILEPGAKKGSDVSVPKNESPSNKEKGGQNSTGEKENEAARNSDSPKALSVYSKFDFVPGDKPLFFDDFSKDFVGDFPSQWNTNGSGELVTINNGQNKWLKLVPGYNTLYIPDISEIPEEFTLEFDVITNGLTDKTSSTANLNIMIADNQDFETASNFAYIEYPFCQYIDANITIENRVGGNREIRNSVDVDLRKVVLEEHHISLAVNKQRLRFWVNEEKFVDVPRLMPSNITMRAIKLSLSGTDINNENIYVSNFKVNKGGLDLRQKLLADGKISTNGILFDSGSANIQPKSMGIILQISQVLQQESGMKLKIVGHTDADGADDNNLKLSKERAEAVKKALVNIYSIDGNRLNTEGKGETEPVADNSNSDGKSQNRRVEFIKQ